MGLTPDSGPSLDDGLAALNHHVWGSMNVDQEPADVAAELRSSYVVVLSAVMAFATKAPTDEINAKVEALRMQLYRAEPLPAELVPLAHRFGHAAAAYEVVKKPDLDTPFGLGQYFEEALPETELTTPASVVMRDVETHRWIEGWIFILFQQFARSRARRCSRPSARLSRRRATPPMRWVWTVSQ